MIKWGIIGLGNMGQKFASAIKETSTSEIVGIASKERNNIKNFIELKNRLNPLCKNFVDFGNYFSENVELD